MGAGDHPLKGSLKGDIHIDIDIDVEVEVDTYYLFLPLLKVPLIIKTSWPKSKSFLNTY